MHVKAATFLVGKEGFKMRPFPIPGQGRRRVRHVRDQVQRLLIRILPHGQDADWTILLRREPGWLDGQFRTTLRRHRADGELLPSTVINRLGVVRHTYCHFSVRRAA
jgi:hypothetical protein